MPQADSNSSPSIQGQQQTTETVPNLSSYTEQFQDETIDFYELWITLWRRKWLVVATTVVAALGSIAYAFQQQSIYKAQTLLLPPNKKDFQAINLIGLQGVGGLYFREKGNEVHSSEITADEVFSKFKQNLKSRDMQKKFIQDKGLLEILAPDRNPETRDEEIYNGFAKLFKLEDENGFTSLSIEMHSAKLSAQWVNDFVEFVNKQTVDMFVEDLEHSIENEIQDIKYNISSKRSMAEQRREDQIVRYSEHAQIAKELGMHSRVDATNIVQNTQLNVDIATTATSPLYYLGYEALMTEINVLNKRTTDDPFISGLRDLQEELEMLRSIKLNKERMSTVTIDQPSYVPKIPYKPNRRLIVSYTTLVGFFSGIFLVFLIEFVINQRKKHSV